MYQVIKMYGDLEPWWFLEGWKDDILKVQEFEDYYEALKYYKQEWFDLMGRYPSFNSKSSVMTAFWDSKDQRWCEECGEDLATVLLPSSAQRLGGYSQGLASTRL
ncbi:superoxide dismutase [Streptococcus sobrinus DSM 20742 = ATCC 33478]|nr:superoxide dismutase [Streptococcus sobrinus DSM 20742 = ATCC 33478]